MATKVNETLPKLPNWSLTAPPPRTPDRVLTCTFGHGKAVITVYDARGDMGGAVAFHLWLDHFSDEPDIYVRRDIALPLLLDELEKAADVVRAMI